MRFKLIPVTRRFCKYKFEIIRKMHLAWHDHVMAKAVQQETKRNFQCNICGSETVAFTVDICSRDRVSCKYCGSTLRYRSIIHILSLELFGKSIVLKDFPVDKNICGLGMSDWEGYAEILAKKFSYTNTFYHKEPKLDISYVPKKMLQKYDFLISSDVFEHVFPPVVKAFSNSRNLLKKNGTLILTVPYMLFVRTWEHYQHINKLDVVFENGRKQVVNTSEEGDVEIFEDPVFHGGDGSTLELRIFSRSCLKEHFQEGGFVSSIFHRPFKPEFGIFWPTNWSLVMTANV